MSSDEDIKRDHSVKDLRKSPRGYDWSFIGYFDILGMSERFSELSPTELREFIGFTRRFSKADGPYQVSDLESCGVRSFRFQDGFIRACELGWIKDAANPDDIDKYTWGRLGYVIHAELVSYCHIIINFMRQGAYIRGACTIGEISFDEDFAMGSGMAKAHEIESREAEFPRIVIPNTVVTGIMQHRFVRGFCSKVISIDHDGWPFVDYLKEACSESSMSPHAFANLMVEHRAWVIRFCEAAGNDTRKRRKADWLADYHNDTVANYPGLALKTGYEYADLAVKEPKTAAARLRRRWGKGKTVNLGVFDRGWHLYKKYPQAEEPDS